MKTLEKILPEHVSQWMRESAYNSRGLLQLTEPKGYFPAHILRMYETLLSRKDKLWLLLRPEILGEDCRLLGHHLLLDRILALEHVFFQEAMELVYHTEAIIKQRGWEFRVLGWFSERIAYEHLVNTVESVMRPQIFLSHPKTVDLLQQEIVLTHCPRSYVQKHLLQLSTQLVELSSYHMNEVDVDEECSRQLSIVASHLGCVYQRVAKGGYIIQSVLAYV